MSRRNFLRLLAGSAATGLLATTACGGRVSPLPRRRSGARVRAVAFDLFTIFDPRSVEAVAEAVVPGDGAELARTWRARQFEYAFVRAAAGQYVDFRQVTGDALVVAARARNHALSVAQRRRLVDAYEQLELWPDSRAALLAMKAAGLLLAPLANYSPSMIAALVTRAGIADIFDHQISTDAVRSYKPDPRAYQLGVDVFGLARDEIAFAAFGGWDAAGATWFGYRTFWVNRLGQPTDELVALQATGPDLATFAAWVLAAPG